MRIIDADALEEKIKGTSRYFNIKFDIDESPTIDPESLPVVQQLQAELEKVKKERDAAILLGGAEHPFILAKNKEGEAGIWFNIVFDKEKQRFLEVVP